MPALLNRSIGDYRLVEFLGAGGMGEVYRAVHHHLGRTVAVKVLTNTDPQASHAARFRNEARIHARLQHEHIARLYEYGEVDGQPCLIMEYVEGPMLSDLIASSRGLSAPEAVRLFREVVEAVRYMHEQGIVHRDLKPSNIKVTPSGQVKLLDFGISKGAATPRLTRTGNIVGTVHCLAPEQIRGQDADVRSDIWALGVVFYEMVSGQVPFEATNVLDLYERISKATFLPPSTLNPGVPRGVEKVIQRCLRKNPADRYASAEDLLKALTRYAGTGARDGGISLRDRAGVWFQSWRSGRPHSEAAATSVLATGWWAIPAGLVVLLLIAMIAWPRGASEAPPPPPEDPESTVAVRIDLPDGTAQVYQPDGVLVSQTPYLVRAVPGTRLRFVLRREGYKEKSIEIEFSGRYEDRVREYLFPMEKIRR
ncbi:MAG TPA: serine/threonine-protein kinase [Rhodothermales bacterium]|nr:serine/threonine-protein kinase [Rhodothermales bacterium]